MKDLRPWVFFPPVILLLGSGLFSLIDAENFLLGISNANNWILEKFDFLFLGATLSFLLILLFAYFSSLSKLRIGGKDAKPILSRWQWFSITLCTTIATGILFWGVAEPIFHVHEGPEKIQDPRAFAMSTMFMHWTLIPYGIYTIAALVFAIGFYNRNQPFRVSTLLFPLLGKNAHGPIGTMADIVCLFALVAGMAASLGGGIMSISGGINEFMGILPGRLVYALIGLVIVGTFVLSAASGLQKGIKWLSDINMRFFFAFALFVLIAGPTFGMLKLGLEGGLDFLLNFFTRSLGLDKKIEQEWVWSWTVFNWANWLAWAPVTALFLGRIAYGYTVREFIIFNLFLPSVFGAAWMIIFSGSTIQLDGLLNGELYQSLNNGGPQSIIYRVLDQLPLTGLVGFIFLLIVFISYVTAADSNTSAMTGMSMKSTDKEHQEAPLTIKIIWGVLVGVISWVMISYAGIEGIKMISTIGGFPALFLIMAVALGLVRLLLEKDY